MIFFRKGTGMKFVTMYQDAQVALTIELVKNCQNGLTCDSCMKLTPRERQLILLLGKNDQLSSQAVEKLIAKVDIEKLANQGIISFTTQQLDGIRQTAIVEPKNAVTPNTQTNTSPAVASAQRIKDIKNSEKANRLQSFLSAYKMDVAESTMPNDAENCSADKCAVCDKAATCEAFVPMPQPVANTNESSQGAHTYDEIDPDFEAIMIAQAMINVA